MYVGVEANHFSSYLLILASLDFPPSFYYNVLEDVSHQKVSHIVYTPH